MEGERRREEEDKVQPPELKKEALFITASLKQGWQYVKAYFTAQGRKLSARNEKEASEADLQKAKMQIEATDEAERRKKELNINT